MRGTCMETVSTHLLEVIHTRDNGLMEISLAKGNTLLLMEISTKDNG